MDHAKLPWLGSFGHGARFRLAPISGSRVQEDAPNDLPKHRERASTPPADSSGAF